MATPTKYLEYTIVLTDKTVVAAQQALHPVGIQSPPTVQAALWSAPILEVGATYFNPPHLASPWFLPNSNYPRDGHFSRKSGGWFGLSFLFGNTTNYIWVGKFVWNAAADAVDGETEIVNLAKIKFLIGFETQSGGEMASLSDGVRVHREASRHADGFGYFAPGTGEAFASPSASGDAVVNKVWERFYFRCLTSPTTGPARMWRCRLTGGASRGASINMAADRRLVVHNIADAGAETALGSSSTQYELNRWYKVDVLLEAKNPGGNLRVYVNGGLVINATAPNGTGIGNTDTHNGSWLGPGALGLGSTGQFHFDDWTGAEWPTQGSGGAEHFPGKDWNNGTRVRLAPPSGLATGNNWTGSYFGALHWLSPDEADANAKMTTIVSGDALRLTINDASIVGTPGSIGVIAFVVGWYGRQQTAGNGTLGWKFDGLIDLAAHVEGTSAGWTRRWYRPTGSPDPIPDIAPFELHKVKAANVNQADCWAFTLSAAHLGTFGDEDVMEDTGDEPIAVIQRKGVHNAPYPQTPWAKAGLAPSSPVVIHSGTYAGNGTIQELQFRCPVNWLMIIRTLSGSATGHMWWSSMVSGHSQGRDGTTLAAGLPVQVLIDPTLVPSGVEDDQEQRTIVRIVGDNAENNGVGQTYQYIAFQDPGMRYHINGTHSSPSAQFSSKDISLGHSTFLPRVTFFHQETPNNSSTSYLRYFKGLGHATDGASVMNLAENASGWRHAAGVITALGLALTGSTNSKAFSAWRNDDQSTDPNKLNVVAVGTYVGDGAASRTITFGTSGKRPLYLIVQPHNTTHAHHRSPFNLTNTSAGMGTGTNTTTGITAGAIDSFTVGSTLNANGITYSWFMLIGSDTAGNGGWSVDGEFSVVEPDSPADGDWEDPADIDDPSSGEPDPDPDPGPDDGDDCDDGEVCVEATTKIVNLALLEIGSIQVLDNYCTQDTKEAVIARRIYEQCVRHTLITYPWPFATKYASLALTATQPSNEDWTYSYRMPVDCIFPRRIVVARGTAVDPSPPPMGLSSDDSGGIILCNEPDALLEYTARPGCVGFNGDDLFREALKWRLAAAFAPPLTRIAGEAERCLKMFEVIVQKAESIVKQGVPGLRPAAPTLDVSAAAIAANIQVVNMALIKIGSRTIANLATEQTREAVAANLVFEDTLRQVLRDFPWAFATRYLDPATLVDGAESDPATPDWTFSHRLPTDLVSLRRLVTVDGDWSAGAPRGSVGRSFDPNPYPFRIASDATGGLLYSNVEEPVVEYTARLTNILVYADPLFREALSWKLAATLAPSLASVELHRPEQHGRGPETPQDPTRRIAQRYNDQTRRVNIAQWANAMYERALTDAQVADRNESQPEPHGDADWIRGRE